MMILNVETNSQTFDVSYNNVSEHVLIKELNLKPASFPSTTQDEEITLLENEVKILNHFSAQGFTHIKDPQSSLNPYLISEHIDFIRQHISSLNYETALMQVIYG